MSSLGENEAPTGEFREDGYVSRQGAKNEAIPVKSDGDQIEDPIDPETADTDQQLERDDNEAIDKGNIMKDRTRHAAKPGAYREPGDDEGIPTDINDGTSSADQVNPTRNPMPNK